MGILVWSGGILTLNYVTIPNFPQGKIDPTFIASVFTGVLATFGVQTAKNKNGNGGGGASGGVSKADMEMLIAKATEAAPAQTIRIEQAPLQIGNPPAPQGPAIRRHLQTVTMQKVINVSVLSFVGTAGIVGGGTVVYLRRDAIAEQVKERVAAAAEAITGALPGSLIVRCLNFLEHWWSYP